jgi:hypothetical protein
VSTRTTQGWEELFFDAGAATPTTIVNAWARHNASEITQTGRRAVESAASHFYFTSPGAMGPAGWEKCWYGIDTGVPAAQKKLLLGGEMSMWSDTYCYIDQCGSSPGPAPVGHEVRAEDSCAARFGWRWVWFRSRGCWPQTTTEDDDIEGDHTPVFRSSLTPKTTRSLASRSVA